jgi:hypothetical protein
MKKSELTPEESQNLRRVLGLVAISPGPSREELDRLPAGARKRPTGGISPPAKPRCEGGIDALHRYASANPSSPRVQTRTPSTTLPGHAVLAPGLGLGAESYSGTSGNQHQGAIVTNNTSKRPVFLFLLAITAIGNILISMYSSWLPIICRPMVRFE